MEEELCQLFYLTTTLSDHPFFFSTLHPHPIGRVSLYLGLMDLFPEFKEIPPMPPVATVGDYGMLVLSGAGGESGMGRGDIHQLEDLILAQFLFWGVWARSCLGRIGTGER